MLDNGVAKENLKDNLTIKDEKNISKIESKTIKYISESIGYFISYENLFSTWLEMGSSFNVSNVHDALSAFNRNIDKNSKKVFEEILIHYRWDFQN